MTDLTACSQNKPNIPAHVAVIMDGNGRWAQERGLPRVEGHRVGKSRLEILVKESVKLGIDYLTLFAFSTENWNRPQKEVSVLMDLFQHVLLHEVKKLHKENIRLFFFGDFSRLSPTLQSLIKKAHHLTQNNTGLRLNIGVNYGGRQELTHAMSLIADKIATGLLSLENITDDMIAEHLYLKDCPAPDLLIRTSGERRISNFLLWDLAYTELYFTDVYWPEFAESDLHEAIDAYQQRERRFGLVSPQKPTELTPDTQPEPTHTKENLHEKRA